MEFGNVADWTQGLAAIAALGVSVIISKNSNEALLKQNKETIEHDKIKTKIKEIKKEMR